VAIRALTTDALVQVTSALGELQVATGRLATERAAERENLVALRLTLKEPMLVLRIVSTKGLQRCAH
jgi:hypothetical protein